MSAGLSEVQLNEIRRILREFKAVDAAILFGSRAMGTFSPASDVDIALMGTAVSLRDQIRISAQLNESKSLLKYDILRQATITNEKLIEHIRAHGITIYKRGDSKETRTD